jgi:hypothetical protein
MAFGETRGGDDRFSAHDADLGLHLSDFSSGDRVAGNAGGAMADLGYRLVF